MVKLQEWYLYGIDTISGFQENKYWKNIGCLVLDPTFGLGESIMWEKEDYHRICGNKRKGCSIITKVYLYEVFMSYIIYCLIFIL